MRKGQLKHDKRKTAEICEFWVNNADLTFSEIAKKLKVQYWDVAKATALYVGNGTPVFMTIKADED